uniref:tetratricopeptide repeat protein n=1 Tax=Halopseudomonas bauzanensis TaxID=653930 RepID=UPI00255760C8
MIFKHLLGTLFLLSICSSHVNAAQNDAEMSSAQQLARGEEYYLADNYDQARHWFQLAAEQGIASAQFLLGTMYDSGKGFPQDYAQARHWWEQAAVQGH